MEIDEAALEALSRLAKAKEDENKLRQSENNILRRREQIALDDIDETTKLRHEVREHTNELDKLADEIAASILGQKLVAQELRQVKAEMEQMQSNMVLLLTEKSQVRIQEAAKELEEVLTLKKQKKQHTKNLAQLQEQASKHGSLDVPLRLANQIEGELEALAEIEEKLNYLT